MQNKKLSRKFNKIYFKLINKIRILLGMRPINISHLAPQASIPATQVIEEPVNLKLVLQSVAICLLLAVMIGLIFWGYGKLYKSPVEILETPPVRSVKVAPESKKDNAPPPGQAQTPAAAKSENLQAIEEAFKTGIEKGRVKAVNQDIEKLVATALQNKASTTDTALAVGYLLARKDIAQAEKIIKILQSTKQAKNASRKINMMYLTRLMSQNQTQQTLDGIARYIEKYGDGPAIAGLEGQALLKLNQTEKAQAALKRSIEAGLSNPQVPLTLAEIYWKNNRKSQAVAVIKDGIRNYPRSAALNVAQGVIYQQEKDYQAAKKAYLSALEKDKTSKMALNNISWLLAVELKEPAAALDFAQQLIALKPQAPGMMDTAGWVLHLNGKHQEALPLLEAAAKKASGNTEIQQHYDIVKKAAGY